MEQDFSTGSVAVEDVPDFSSDSDPVGEGYAGLAPLPPITDAQLASAAAPEPLWHTPAVSLLAPENEFVPGPIGLPRIPAMGAEGSRLRGATEFAGGLEESLGQGLSGMTTRQGIATLPVLAVPFVGPSTMAVMGAESVGAGAGELLTGAELHDPRMAASGFGQVLLGAPMLGAAGPMIELPRSMRALAQQPAIDVETVPPPVRELRPFLPGLVQPGARAGLAIPSAGEPMSRPGLPTQPKPPAPVVPETVAEARESVIEAIRKADARTLSQIQALFPEARLSREQARTFRNIAFPPVPEPVRPQATVAEVLGQRPPEPPPEPGAETVPKPPVTPEANNAATLALYEATEPQTWRSSEPISLEQFDADVGLLEAKLTRGKLKPEDFNSTESGQKLSISARAQLNAALKADPKGTIDVLRRAIDSKKQSTTGGPNALYPETETPVRNVQQPEGTGEGPREMPTNVGGEETGARGGAAANAPEGEVPLTLEELTAIEQKTARNEPLTANEQRRVDEAHRAFDESRAKSLEDAINALPPEQRALVRASQAASREQVFPPPKIVPLDPIGNAAEFYSLPRLRALERSADPRIAVAKKYYGAKTIPELARLANARFEEMAKPKPAEETKPAAEQLTPEEQAAAQRQLEEEVPAARAEEAPTQPAPAATEAPVEKVVTKPINQITAEDLPELEAGAKPLYEKLEALGEKAFVGETRPGMYSAKYTPEAEAIDQQIEPYRKRIEVAKALKAEAEMKERNRQAIESRDKRIASAPVFQRRNGWEIVREGAQFAVRHPITKEEAYIGRLQRARQVADESRPEPPTAPKPAAPETPDSGRVRYRVLVTGETKRFQKVEGQWFREVGDKPTGKPLDPTIALTKALDAQLARESAPAPETPAVPPPGPPEPPREFGMAAGGGFGGRRFGLDMANLWQDIKALWQRRPIKRDMAQLADAMIDTIPANKGREAGTELRVLTKEKKGGRLIDNALARKAAVFVIQAKGDPAKLAGDLVKVKGNAEAEAAIKYAQENWDALQPLAERTKTILDEQINYERTNGIDTEYENHYVPQRHENIVTDRGVLFGETRSGTGSTGFKKAKVFPDYASAIEAGYIPRNLDIADLVEHRVRTGQRLVNRKLWADGFRTIDDPFSGEPIVTDMVARKIPRPDGTTDVQFSAPAGYVVKEIIPGVRIAVRQGYSHLFDALTETSQIRKSVVGRAGLAASGWLKHQLLLLDTFHASRTMQTSLAARGSTSYGKGISLLEYSDRALTDAVNHNLITPEMAAWVRTPQPFEIGGKTVHMTPREVAQLGQKNGLNVGRFADALYNEAKGIVGTNPFSRWLFEKLTRGAMVETFLSEFGRVAKANPTMNSTAVARKVARDINVLFGNLQRQGFIKNPAIRDMMQMVFLAPQWVESLARRELRAVGQTAQAGLGAATGKGLHVGTVAKTVGTGLAAYVALTQLLNYLSRGHSTLENQEGEHKLDAFIPDPTGQSDGFWFSPLSVFGEITHDLIRYSHTEPTAADIPQRIAENKLGPVGRSLKVMATGEDPFGTKLPTTWDRAKEAGLQLVPLPIGVQPIAQAVGKELGVEGMREPRPGALVRQAAGSLGFKIEPYKADEAKMKRARQVNTYIEYWKKQARQLPMEQRRIYIEKAMSDANLSPLERNKAKREFGEAGLFKYR